MEVCVSFSAQEGIASWPLKALHPQQAWPRVLYVNYTSLGPPSKSALKLHRSVDFINCCSSAWPLPSLSWPALDDGFLSAARNMHRALFGIPCFVNSCGAAARGLNEACSRIE
eukprot:3824009-Pleurochrysis_carterae.AAC.1